MNTGPYIDSDTSTEDLHKEIKTKQENILLEVIKEICSDPKGKMSSKLVGKVNRIIADCNLTHYSSLHKISTANESTSTILGFLHQSSSELTFDEQTEFNAAIIQQIQTKIPEFALELENLKSSIDDGKKNRQGQRKELNNSLDDKLNALQEQETAKVELMMEWLNHRLLEVSKFNNTSTELLTLKTRILELKSKILHLQILQNIFTETNQSIKAYCEVHKDLKDSIRETEERIRNYKDVIEKL